MRPTSGSPSTASAGSTRMRRCGRDRCHARATHEVVGVTGQGNRPGGMFCERHAREQVGHLVADGVHGMWGVYPLDVARPMIPDLITPLVAAWWRLCAWWTDRRIRRYRRALERLDDRRVVYWQRLRHVERIVGDR